MNESPSILTERAVGLGDKKDAHAHNSHVAGMAGVGNGVTLHTPAAEMLSRTEAQAYDGPSAVPPARYLRRGGAWWMRFG